jgi:hypothetical protein
MEEKMPIDLVIAVVLTASAAAAAATLAAALPASGALRIGAAAALSAWFFAVVAIGASGLAGPEALGTPAVGAAVLLPVLAVTILVAVRPSVRALLLAIPLPVLVGVNAVRVLGVFFLLLYAAGRLPAPFAPIAGWGDIAVGLAALPVALIAARRTAGWLPIVFGWNLLGLADLVVAIGLGVTSAPDSPMRLFGEGPGSQAMSVLPMFLVPGFLVPLLTLTHIAVFVRLAREATPLRLRATRA